VQAAVIAERSSKHAQRPKTLPCQRFISPPDGPSSYVITKSSLRFGMLYNEIDALITELESIRSEQAISRVRDLMEAIPTVNPAFRSETLKALRRAGRQLQEGAVTAAKDSLETASLKSRGGLPTPNA